MTIKLQDFYSGNAFDAQDVVSEGYTGVIFKAGQGGWADVPRYKPDWWKQARDAGLLVGWYWLCDSRYHSSKHIKEMEQWKIFDDVGSLGLWVDVEKPVISMTEVEYWKTYYAGYRNVVDFVYLINDHGVKPGIYTGPGAYELIMRGAPKTAHDYLAEHCLWTAQYPFIYIPNVSNPTMYGSWKVWEFWQYREGPDVNIFNGTAEQYYFKYGEGNPPIEPPIEPPTGDIMNYKGTVKSGLSANIKSLTGVPSGTVATLPSLGYVYGVDGGTDIIKFTHYYRPTGQKMELGYECKVSKTNLICTTETEPGTEPPTEPPPSTSTDLEVIVKVICNEVTVIVNGDNYVKEV